ASAPSIVEMCAELPEYAVPPTLVHGDLHARNALMNGHDLVLIDWSEACVTHPFMDAFMIYNEQDVSVRDRMRDSYLSRWATFESFDRLLELWSLCGVVHAMHHAVSYGSILRHTPEHARGDLANTLPFLLRKALRYLHEPA
ncbi:MAG TPA: phosphotransferase, partial [Thermomicrobiales bacterium]|nr:phosphotransferase [Thermomicrobiales bacterium]